MSKKSMRIASIANQLYITDLREFKEAGVLDKIIKMVPFLDKIAPDFVEKAERTDDSDEMHKKAVVIGEFLGNSKYGNQINIPAKRPSELATKSSSTIIKAMENTIEILDDVLQQKSMKINDDKLKAEAKKMKDISLKAKSLVMDIKKFAKDIHDRFGALEKDSGLSPEDKKVNARALSAAEKVIQSYLAEVYDALFGPAIMNHKWGYGANIKKQTASSEEAAVTEPLEGDELGSNTEEGITEIATQ